VSVLQSLYVLAETAGGSAPAPGAGGAGDSIIPMLTLFGPMIIIFWLFIIRPESKRRKEKENLLGKVKPKDKVTTIGGLQGTVVEIEGDDVVILADPKKDVKLRFRRSAIDSVTPPEEKK
jgi:preprotein translocase subunit YajC